MGTLAAVEKLGIRPVGFARGAQCDRIELKMEQATNHENSAVKNHKF